MVNILAIIFTLTSMLFSSNGFHEFEYGNGLVSLFQTSARKTAQNSGKSDEGKDVYVKYCISCHQTDGSGVPNMFPPIFKSDWVNGDKNRIINVLLNGLEGDIEVNEAPYSQVMPKQDYLTDMQIALVLTYIRQNFGNNADAVLPADVARLRGKK
jgi:mono/diheme cytochrome c family protein